MESLSFSMRCSGLCLVVMGLITVFGAMGEATQAQDESLVLYLHFDEGGGDKVKDASMYGNNGVLMNDPKWVQGQPDYGTALEFSTGVRVNWVEVPHSESLNITDEITMMAWVVNKGQTDYGRIMAKHSPYCLFVQKDDSLDTWLKFAGGAASPFGSNDAKVPRAFL